MSNATFGVRPLIQLEIVLPGEPIQKIKDPGKRQKTALERVNFGLKLRNWIRRQRIRLAVPIWRDDELIVAILEVDDAEKVVEWLKSHGIQQRQ